MDDFNRILAESFIDGTIDPDAKRKMGNDGRMTMPLIGGKVSVSAELYYDMRQRRKPATPVKE
jgi:hypothetical protein